MARLIRWRLNELMISTHPVSTWLLIAATVVSGLAAGLLYAFAVAVMPGLRQVPDATFVSVMQSINTRIVNPWFLATFLGAPLLAIAAVVSRFVVGGEGPRWPLLAGAALAVLSVLITAAANIPLNNALDAAGSLDPAGARAAFENGWVAWNVARAVVATAGFALLVLALAVG